jgi:hypothetical protein
MSHDKTAIGVGLSVKIQLIFEFTGWRRMGQIKNKKRCQVLGVAIRRPDLTPDITNHAFNWCADERRALRQLAREP